MKIQLIERLGAILQGVILGGFVSVGIVGIWSTDDQIKIILGAFYCIIALALILLSLIRLLVSRAQ